MSFFAGEKIVAEDFFLPTPATATGSGVNSITSTSYAALPSFPVSTSMTNGHPSLYMLCLVTYSAWVFSSSSSVFGRVSLELTGGLPISAGSVGSGAAAGFGEIIRGGINDQYQSSFTALLPAGTTTTFEMRALRESAVPTVQVNYGTIRVTPLRYSL